VFQKPATSTSVVNGGCGGGKQGKEHVLYKRGFLEGVPNGGCADKPTFRCLRTDDCFQILDCFESSHFWEGFFSPID
jgi:hypothetical protein